MRVLRLIGALAVIAAGPAFAEPAVSVVGNEFRITRADGSVAAGEDVVGAVLSVAVGNGAVHDIRIDAVEKDPDDPDITLYGLSYRDPASGAWADLCEPDPKGRRRGFPLPGAWTATGEYRPDAPGFVLTCTSGAQGKCVRFGYKPWKDGVNGVPMRDLYQACTRMVRADYCGDGVGTTRNGMLIDLYDRFGIQNENKDAPLSFEAGWGPDGAVCVARVRVPENTSLDALVHSCPQKLAGRTGADCSAERALTLPGVLIRNKS